MHSYERNAEVLQVTTSHLLPRVFGQDFPLIVRAEGIRMYDADGKEYIDSTSGAISVASVGHGRREVADAIHAQVLRMDYVHDNDFHNEPAHELANRITAFMPSSGLPIQVLQNRWASTLRISSRCMNSAAPSVPDRTGLRTRRLSLPSPNNVISLCLAPRNR